MFGGFKISKNYALDYMFLYKIRDFKDGISFINYEMSLDLYKTDHNPSFDWGLYLFNFTIFQITIYNVNHVEEKSDDDFNDYDNCYFI